MADAATEAGGATATTGADGAGGSVAAGVGAGGEGLTACVPGTMGGSDLAAISALASKLSSSHCVSAARSPGGAYATARLKASRRGPLRASSARHTARQSRPKTGLYVSAATLCAMTPLRAAYTWSLYAASAGSAKRAAKARGCPARAPRGIASAVKGARDMACSWWPLRVPLSACAGGR